VDTGSTIQGVSEDTIYEILANPRRRYVIHYLQYENGPVDLGTLAERVAAWETETDDPDLVPSEQRKAVYTALQQRHLPRMDDAALVSFDSRAGTIESTDALGDLDIYTEVVPEGDFAWSVYYLGLSAITGTLLVAAWAGAPPLAALPDIAWAVFCTTAFLISSAVHLAITRGMKLGLSERPPEVDA